MEADFCLLCAASKSVDVLWGRKNETFFFQCNAENTFGILGLFENVFLKFSILRFFSSFIWYIVTSLFRIVDNRWHEILRHIFFRRKFVLFFALLMLFRFDMTSEYTSRDKIRILIDVIDCIKLWRSRCELISIYVDWVSFAIEMIDLFDWWKLRKIYGKEIL